MTRSDLIVEAAAGAAAAVVVALVSERVHQQRVRARETSEAEPDDRPRTRAGRAFEFLCLHIAFRSVMGAIRAIARPVVR